MVKTEDLYTAADITKVREQLLKEQQGHCALTGLKLPSKIALDHIHNDEQLVRGVVSNTGNIALGKIENLHGRYIKWWYDGTLPDFLRASADYIEKHNGKNKETRWRHLGWIKVARTRFNQLNAASQNKVLEHLGGTSQSNPAKRKDLFGKLVLDRKLGYNTIMQLINQHKGV